jgi:hypothetical protein
LRPREESSEPWRSSGWSSTQPPSRRGARPTGERPGRRWGRSSGRRSGPG